MLEVVLSGCLNRQGLHFFYTPAQRSEAMMNLGKLGILELKDACYRDLSGGQQQRVLLARALCAASQLLILDEPITGLDPAAAQDFYKTLAYLNQKEGMAIVMVTPRFEGSAEKRPHSTAHRTKGPLYRHGIRLSGESPGPPLPGGTGIMNILQMFSYPFMQRALIAVCW